MHDDEWAIARDGRLLLTDETLSIEWPHAADEPATVLATEVVGVPAISADGTRFVFGRNGPGDGLTVLDAVSISADGLSHTTLIADGTPDRVAISADGQWVAWVSGITGIASVWAMPFEGGAPVQLTNRDLVRIPGQEPAGFVPPPHRAPLRFEGTRIVWESPAGAHEVALP